MKYEAKGNEIYRDGELVAKVIDGELKMEEGKEKFQAPASRMVKGILRNLEEEEALKKAEALTPISGLVKEESAKEEPVKEEVVKKEPKKEKPAKDDTAAAELKAEVERLKAEVKALHEGRNVEVDPSLISPILRVKKKAVHNPFGWEVKEGVPACPDGGEKGTKHPDVIAWAEKYYPEEADEFYEAFRVRRQFLQARAEQKKRKKDYAIYK